MADLRKLAAIDIAFLGYKVILAEYVCGVVLSLALGILVLSRSHSGWQSIVGVYFVGLGINYIPMLVWTISIRSREKARAELGDELADRPRAMGKYRGLSLALLIPLAPMVLVVLERRRTSQPGSTASGRS